MHHSYNFEIKEKRGQQHAYHTRLMSSNIYLSSYMKLPFQWSIDEMLASFFVSNLLTTSVDFVNRE